MKTIISLCAAGLCLVAAACAQDDSGLKKKPHHAPAAVPPGPVTEAEADATFDKVASLVSSVLHVSVKPRHATRPSGSAVSRFEVVNEFLRIYRAAEPAFTMTPKLIAVDSKRVTADTPADRKTLIFLIERGYVGNYGPLATGKASGLSVQEFGDSVGFFIARLAESTHSASSKWTPYLHGN